MKKSLVVAVVMLSLAYAQVSFAMNSNFGTLPVAVSVGQSSSLSLPGSPSGNWFVMSNSNSSTASVSLQGNSLLVNGLSVGNSVVSLCDSTSGASVHCMTANVSVSGGSVLGASSYAGSHPAGTWVLSGQTVYLITSAGIIPVPSWQIFLANGGTASAIVPINSADLNLPLLPLMVANDSRVQ